MMDFLNLGKKQSAQRPFFIPVSERKQLLKKLKIGIQQFEHDILKALHQDLGKSEFEAYSSEIGFIYQNINNTLKHINHWSEPQRVKTGLSLFPSKAHIHYQPIGKVLIIAPWNYPFQLSIDPLVACVAAGNRALLKPSELTPATTAILIRLIQHVFNKSEVDIVEGDGKIVVPKAIEEYRPNLIFFTGSTDVGRKISKMAAEYLIPCILELGGKSPCIVDKTADLDIAVKRIAFGKGMNAGQTCVAPDYFLVHEEIETKFTEKLKTSFQAFYQNAIDNEEYTKIINEHHFQRIQNLLKDTQIVFGGKSDKKKNRIEPTLVKCDVDSPIMKEEIFGPISPIFTYKTLKDIQEYIDRNPNPLSLYLFAKNCKLEDKITEEVSFGGGCINNTIMHLVDPNLPFGGIGNSGFGAYHGKAGFDAFSHKKSVVKTGNWFDLKQKYPPYDKRSLRIIKLFLK
jgi:aldehyde dehydrogenase (NAD+)